MNRYFILLFRFSILCSCFLLGSLDSFSQSSTIDSLNYEMQRQKVNALLDQRQARFGQFETSLKSRTGIFGLKTRKDMQASIDILLSIVDTDNEVFQETKKLLNFKDQMLDYQEFEKEKIQGLASEYDQRINGYITTISKLQQEQEKLRSEINSLRSKNQFYTGFFYMFFVTLAGTGLFIWYRKQKLTKT